MKAFAVTFKKLPVTNHRRHRKGESDYKTAIVIAENCFDAANLAEAWTRGRIKGSTKGYYLEEIRHEDDLVIVESILD